MTTDNAPFEYMYISKRLVKEIVQQHESNRHQMPEQNISAAFYRITLKEKEPDYTNLYDLARRATQAVTDNTSRLNDNPSADASILGKYALIRMWMQSQKLSLGNWEEINNHDVAAYVGIQNLPGIGPTFVGLVGSASNYIGAVGNAVSRAKRTPSDAMGLYDIIEATREMRLVVNADGDALVADGSIEPAAQQWLMDREHKYYDSDLDDKARFEGVTNVFWASNMNGPSRYVEMLVKVHYKASDVRLGLDDVDGRIQGNVALGIIGTPIWVRTLPPDSPEIDASQRKSYRIAIPVAQPGDPRLRMAIPGRPDDPIEAPRTIELDAPPALMRTSSWTTFDAQLEVYANFAEHPRQGVAIPDWPPAPDLWTEYCQWFVAQAVDIGPEALPFAVPTGKFKLSRMRTVWDWPFVFSGHAGWFVAKHKRERSGLRHRTGDGWIVLSNARVFESSVEGYYRSDGRPVEVVATAESVTTIASRMLDTVVQWRTKLFTEYLDGVSIRDGMIVADGEN